MYEILSEACDDGNDMRAYLILISCVFDISRRDILRRVLPQRGDDSIATPSLYGLPVTANLSLECPMKSAKAVPITDLIEDGLSIHQTST